MSIKDDPDIELVKSIQATKDQNGFNELFRRYGKRTYNFCLRFLGNPDDAADCSQEIFIRVFRGIENFRLQSQFSTWIYRITMNTCTDMARRRKISFREMAIDSEDGPSIEPGDEISPETVLIRKDINDTFNAALSKLRPDYRSVIILRDIEGRSYEEISSITGIKTGTVKSSLARARMKMASELNEYRYEM